MQNDNVAAARRYVERFLGQNEGEVADELLAESFLYDTGLSPGNPIRGPEATKQAIAGLHASLPDIDLTVEDAFASEDGGRVVVRFRATGTHRGELMGREPTGHEITMVETHVFRFRGGRIVEDYASDNTFDFPWLVAPVLSPFQ